MKIGYARVSSTDQNLERQINALQDAGATKIFTEQVSGKDIQHRLQFQEMIDFLREKDELIVASMDRLSRNYNDLKELFRYFSMHHIKCTILDAPFLTFDSEDERLNQLMQDLFISILGYVSETERKKIKERQRQGIELAKQRGVYKGRKPWYTANSENPQKQLIYQMIVHELERKTPITQISKKTGVSRPTIYKIKAELFNH